MLTYEDLENLLDAVHYVIDGGNLTPLGIKRYKYLEQELLSIQRSAPNNGVGPTCSTCGVSGGHKFDCPKYGLPRNQ